MQMAIGDWPRVGGLIIEMKVERFQRNGM